MGIQDRDYYWEKHQSASKPGGNDFGSSLRHINRPNPPQRKSGSLKYLLIPALVLSSLWLGADRLLKQRAARPPASPSLSIPLGNPADVPISGGLEITADRQGHFRGTVLINHVPMPFLIDTGATITSIPANLAYAANLPVGRPVNTNTAGGKVVDRLTQITSLKIGNAEISNLDATINQHLDEVLIGMNTLKLFTITQSGNTMTLVANGSSPEQIIRAPAISSIPIRPNTLAAEQPIAAPEVKRVTKVKKTVTCNAQQVCTTTYSDH
ncbi:retropepsin-like aspartic protease [Methylomonas sp. UP202]|uniref:retropepsin-like aspartic protease family protein n=1 Tax=Methylomonas sp. UP202 TaxID=3040943 RepID=UPI0024786F56|nr:retropepsin-like aspartic protease [Methylomonas sp. UP202]WGS88624.1 retropepsin-like aspartic protease [Methylomonas sp. UP202]